MTDGEDAPPTADAGLSITAEYDLDGVRADAVRIDTLAALLGVTMTYGTDCETRTDDLAQLARYAGFDAPEIAAARSQAQRATSEVGGE